MQQHEEYHTATSVDSHALVAIASLSLGMVLYGYPRSALVASTWHTWIGPSYELGTYVC